MSRIGLGTRSVRGVLAVGGLWLALACGGLQMPPLGGDVEAPPADPPADPPAEVADTDVAVPVDTDEGAVEAPPAEPAPEEAAPDAPKPDEPAPKPDEKPGEPKPSPAAPKPAEPKPEEPKPAPAGPVPVAGPKGAVKVEGPGRVVLFQEGAGRFPVPGEVPVGTYVIRVKFGDKPVVATGKVKVTEAGVTIKCNESMGLCRGQ